MAVQPEEEAEATRKSLIRSLYEELTCPVCLGAFTDPRVLPCLHSLCLKCIEGMVLASRMSEIR